MQKTENFNLNKPEVTDPLRLEDFNDNADKIDAALGALTERTQVLVGSFVGDDANKRVVELGFTARFLLLVTNFTTSGFISLLGADHGCYINSSGLSTSESRIVPGGVSLVGNGNNAKGILTHYVAVL